MPNEYIETNDQIQNEDTKVSLSQDEISINRTIKNSPQTPLEKSILQKIK